MRPAPPAVSNFREGQAVSVTRRPNGRWRAQVETPAGQRSRIFDLKRDALQWESEQKAAVRRGDFVDPVHGRITFAEFYAEWSKRQIWESGTERAMSLAVRSVPFAETQIAKIRRSHVELWVKQMSDTLAPGTIATRFNNVGAVFRGAVRDQIIGRNPAEGVKLPRQRRRDSTLVLPTPEQIRAVLEASSDEFKVFVSLCAFAGLRLGEAAAVQVRDIDFDAKQLHVSRQVQRANGRGLEIRAPKYGSERTVYLADGLVKTLAEHVATRVSKDAPRWLFRGQGDDPPHQNSIGYLWRKSCAEAGVEGVRLHDTRHFFASGLIEAGADVVTVSRALGHANPTTTLRTYAKIWPSAENRTREAAQGLMQQVNGSAN